MQLSQLTYELPQKLIAQKPITPRDQSRLLALNRNTSRISHHIFSDIDTLLKPNDVLVLNNTKVFPARLIGKKTTGGKVEILLLEEAQESVWTALHRGTLNSGQVLAFGKVSGEVLWVKGELIRIQFNITKQAFSSFLEKEGLTPLPPYIKSTETEEKIRSTYQTVYAKFKGSVAAPTAGLHFTDKLLFHLLSKGIDIEYITLHVGMGTFMPIHTDSLAEHVMHSERYSIKKEVAQKLIQAKKEGRRIISVGTTTTRVLEHFATINTQSDNANFKQLTDQTNLFIYPPYQFKFTDGIITNFHLPKSTLLALVAAFTTYPNTIYPFTTFKESPIGRGYLEAIKNNYRFYSFGDACFIY